MKKDRWHFEVTGKGAFPVDMMRYDSCWPTSSQDSVWIAASFERMPGGTRPRVIRLTSATHPPTVGRWKSFGWDAGEVGAFAE